MIKVSVIVPIYNAEKYLKKCIDSIINQDLKELEIILVNDGSSDCSEKICKSYLTDERVKYISKSNAGAVLARRDGIDKATGEYVGFVDSDDWIEPNMFSTMYNSAIKGNFDFVGSQAIYINELKKNIYNRTPFWVVIWSKLIKKEIYLDSIYEIGIDILKLKVKTLDDDIIALDMFINKTASFEPIIGVVHYTHESSHVYFNSFNNKKNCKRFCTNMLTTIKAFYMFKNPLGRKYGKDMFKNIYNKDQCSQFSDLDVKELEKYGTKT